MTIRSPAYYNTIECRDTSLSPMTTKPQMTMPHKNQEEQPRPDITMPQHEQCGEEGNKNDNRQEEEPIRNCIVDDDDSDSVSLDASSLHSFGSIRPDPNYDPARDPMNPINFKQFIPPKDIIVKTVRARRRKTIGRGDEVRCEEDRSRSLSPMRTPAQAVVANTTPPITPTARHHQQCHRNQQQLRQNYLTALMMPSLDHRPLTKKSESTTSTTLLADSMSSEMLISGDVFHNDRILSTDSIIIDDDDLESDNDNDDDMDDAVEHQNQQQPQQRKGMVRREFGRRILALKERAKNYSSKSNNNGDVINGKDIDRVFGEVVEENNNFNSPMSVNSQNNELELNNSSTSGSSDNTSSTNNCSDVSNINVNRVKSMWHTHLFATKNIFAKQGQENKILQSSIVC